MNCPFCGKPLVDETAKVCPECGSALYTPEGKSHLRLTLSIPKDELPGVDKAKQKAKRKSALLYALTIIGAVFALLSLALGFTGYFDIFLLTLLKVGFACCLVSILFALYFVFKGASSLPGGRLAKTYWPGRIYFLCSGLLNAGLVLAIALSDRLGYSKFYQADDQAFYGYKDGGYELFSLKLSTDSVTVPSVIEGAPIVSIADHLSGTASNTTAITFEGFETFTIKDYAFSGSDKLSSMTFEGDGEYRLGRGSFENCLSLNSIKVDGASLTYDTDYSAFSSVPSPSITLKNGGSLIDYHDHIATLFLSQGSSVSLNNGYLRDGVELMPELGEAVFPDGFTFGEATYTRSRTDLDGNVTYYPFASDIYIPVSVTKITANFFGTVGTCQIHYAGDPAGFRKIEVAEEGNDNFFEGRHQISYYAEYGEE